MALARLLHGDPSPDTPGVTLARGRSYDLFGTVFFGGRRNRVFTRLAELSGAQPGDHALDVGCGTGYLTRRLAEAVAPGGTATGVDPSPDILHRARDAAAAANCSYVTGIAESLDFGTGSFDVVTSSLMVHHLPEDLRGRAVAEMFRVLRPGGRLLLADFRPPAGPVGQHLVGAVTGSSMGHNPVHLLGPLAGQAGFEQVRDGDLRPWIHYVQAVKPPISRAEGAGPVGGPRH